jgi:hypothetical protein
MKKPFYSDAGRMRYAKSEKTAKKKQTKTLFKLQHKKTGLHR